MLKEKHNDVPIRLSTVDRFQGMERNIIIVSMVRSNKLASFQGQLPDEIYGESGYPLQESLGFAESPNRLNVALSRARRLLIVVGNSEHFCKRYLQKRFQNDTA
jgi:superfamily I DNA and/or RNA helicase